MSILNVIWSPEQVTLAVDTGCAAFDGAPPLRGVDSAGSVCKMFPLPSWGAVLAGRGSAAFAPTVVYGVQTRLAGRALDFDGLLQCLPGIISDVRRELSAAFAAAGNEALVFAKYEFAAAGWSAQRGRMAALSFFDYGDGEGQQLFELDDDWPAVIAPRFDHDDWEHMPPRTDAEMLVRARHQVEEAGTKGPKGTGGRLLVANLTRGALTVRDLGKI